MREIRTSGSEGGATQANASSLPLSELVAVVAGEGVAGAGEPVGGGVERAVEGFGFGLEGGCGVRKGAGAGGVGDGLLLPETGVCGGDVGGGVRAVGVGEFAGVTNRLPQDPPQSTLRNYKFQNLPPMPTRPDPEGVSDVMDAVLVTFSAYAASMRAAADILLGRTKPTAKLHFDPTREYWALRKPSD